MIQREFGFAFGVTVIALILAFWYGFSTGGLAVALNFLVIAVVLGVMEVSLSFDNAVVNASVLKNMTEKWQRRFLIWGILIAVVGMRLSVPHRHRRHHSGPGLRRGDPAGPERRSVRYGEYLEAGRGRDQCLRRHLPADGGPELPDGPRQGRALAGGLRAPTGRLGKLDTIQAIIAGVVLLPHPLLRWLPAEQFTALIAGTGRPADLPGDERHRKPVRSPTTWPPRQARQVLRPSCTSKFWTPVSPWTA